jgi:CheY-like chemotaxis protein
VLRRVLLIDDQLDIRRIAELSLGRVGGLEVLLAASGAEGVAMAGAHRPDIILLDAMMPDMDGPATLASLKARPDTLDIPVVFLTARVQAADIERYLGLGAIGVVRKPFDPIGLAAEVRAIFARRAR